MQFNGTCADPSAVKSGRPRYCTDVCRAFLFHIPVNRRFWFYVDKLEPCWLWRASIRAKGYGQFNARCPEHRSILAHRTAWELADGRAVPEGLDVLHTCDVPACVRNDEQGTYEVNGVLLPRWGHLFLGTDTENIADKVAKGRTYCGERHALAKLSDAIALEAIARWEAGGVMQKTLAAEYGVSRGTMSELLSGKNRKYLRQPQPTHSLSVNYQATSEGAT